MTPEHYAFNVLSCYSRATDEERTHGVDWYRDAQAIALELSPGDVWRGAGVLSALSPLKEWGLNVRMARSAFETGIVTGHIAAHAAKAQRILDGEYAMDVLNGDKTRSFCEAIATGGKGTIATIDRHAHDIALNEIHTDATRNIGKKVYREMAQGYSLAAEYLGISVNELQAATWVVWKREKGHK